MQFKNKVAVVTGAGVGIGLEIAWQLAKEGATVFLNDLQPDLVNQAVASIRREGGVVILSLGMPVNYPL